MADFVAVLRKTLEGLGEATPDLRARVYEKARATVEAKLAAISPPPPQAVADRQRASLEEAIVALEAEYAPPPPVKPAAPDPLTELENVFASIGRSRATPTLRPAGPNREPEPATERPKPASERRAEPNIARPEPRAAAAIERTPERPVPAEPAANLAADPADEPEADLFDDLDNAEEIGSLETPEPYDDAPVAERRRPSRNYGGLIAATAVLAILAGGGYGAWVKRDELSAMLGGAGLVSQPSEPAAAPAPAEVAAATPAATEPANADTAGAETGDEPAEAETGDEPADVALATPPADPNEPAAPAAAAPVEAPKFTQRLSADGTEADAGPAGGAPLVGEGTSVAALTQPGASTDATAAGAQPDAPAAETSAPSAADPAAAAAETAAAETPAPDAPEQPAPAQPAADQPAVAEATPAAAAPQPAAGEQVAVGQRAIFYEERTNTSEGSAETGAIVWSLVQESPGDGQPPEPAIRAEATIPGKDLQLRMTIRRNADKTLPASHIVEMIFLTPDSFEGGGIDNVLRVSFKGSEQETGSPLIGMPAKIADGFFLVALNDSKPEMDANLSLLQRQSWIDVPIVYKSGRRALFTMEKGVPGEKVFAEAIKAWQAASG